MQGDRTCRGYVVKFGGQLSVAEAQILDSEGRLLASGRGVYMTAPPK
jgi:acyl-coenzyme A thioesterase PaaI-like protein